MYWKIFNLFVFLGMGASFEALAVNHPDPSAKEAEALMRLLAGNQRLVVFVMDGVRSREVFDGSDTSISLLPKKYPTEILPKTWAKAANPNLLATNLILGGRGECKTGNDFQFSLPAYSEIFSAKPQSAPRYSFVNSNDWNGKLHFETIPDRLFKLGMDPASIALIGSWENLPRVFSKYKMGDTLLTPFYMDAGWNVLGLGKRITRLDDSGTFEGVKEYLKGHDPRVMFVVYNDPDQNGHHGSYEAYVSAIQRADDYTQRIKDILNGEVTHPDDQEFASGSYRKSGYKGNTTYILMTDHGRGLTPVGWRSHDPVHPGSELIWAHIESSPEIIATYRVMLNTCNHMNIMTIAAGLLGI